MNTLVPSIRTIATLGAALGVSTLVGCGMGNYSNPTLSISSAQMSTSRATLGLEVANPSDFDLTLNQIDYTLTYGIFPVASGTYRGHHVLPSGGSALIRLPVTFDSQPIDAGDEIELSGEMRFEDASNKGNMQLTSAGFTARAPASR